MTKVIYYLFAAILTLTIVACGSESENFDCAALELNIGDTCDDGNANTENDAVSANCICAGIVIYDCTSLGLNFGDPCDDGDDNTENDVINDDCECSGTAIPINITYTNTIKAIIDGSCANSPGCHGAGTAIFPMTNYEEVKIAVGFTRIPGAINYDFGYSPMPPGGKLDEPTIKTVEDWITAGAPE